MNVLCTFSVVRIIKGIPNGTIMVKINPIFLAISFTERFVEGYVHLLEILFVFSKFFKVNFMIFHFSDRLRISLLILSKFELINF